MEAGKTPNDHRITIEAADRGSEGTSQVFVYNELGIPYRVNRGPRESCSDVVRDLQSGKRPDPWGKSLY